MDRDSDVRLETGSWKENSLRSEDHSSTCKVGRAEEEQRQGNMKFIG